MCLQYRHLLQLRMPPKQCPHKQSTEQSLECLVSVLKILSQPLTKDSILPPSHTEDECTLQVAPWFTAAAAPSLTPATASQGCAGSQLLLSPSLVSQCLLSPGACSPALQAGGAAQQRGDHVCPWETMGCEPRAPTPTQPRCSFEQNAPAQKQMGLQGLHFLKPVCSTNTTGNTKARVANLTASSSQQRYPGRFGMWLCYQNWRALVYSSFSQQALNTTLCSIGN